MLRENHGYDLLKSFFNIQADSQQLVSSLQSRAPFVAIRTVSYLSEKDIRKNQNYLSVVLLSKDQLQGRDRCCTSFLTAGSLKARSTISGVGIIFHVGIILVSLVRAEITNWFGFTSSAICTHTQELSLIYAHNVLNLQ